MRLGVDAMGGDFAPAQPVLGVLAARDLLEEGDEIVLIGDEEAIREHLEGQDGWEDFIRIEHAPDIIGMSEVPVESLRSKPNSSIARMTEMARKGKLDAIISAGNTGACVAASQMRLRRLRGVVRPGIAIVIPTSYGPVTMCDVGANVNCRARHLYQYAIMASEYALGICGVKDARVGLLSIGEEDEKGNALVKETRELLRSDPMIKFVGNVEGQDIFRGACDVAVTEGFMGNVALKLMEGLADGLVKSLLTDLSQTGLAERPQVRDALAKIKDKYDFNEYGGAPLLGVNGISIICHGASHARAISNAVRVAREFATLKINDRITTRIAHCQGSAHE
ncbi:MAG: phosphate acyltransferase PlsX [Planctomycetota bacterium]|jgi:glycerol-3-phosphate acyltransferase PlsX